MSETKKKNMIKPFTVNINKDSEDITDKKPKEKMIKPFVIEEAPKTKLYLVLKYYSANSDNGEDYKDYEFFTGTTQEMYDHLKVELENSDGFDAMRSRILVDSPNITISHKCSVYLFMKDAKDIGKVVDESSFNINDYYYDTEDLEV